MAGGICTGPIEALPGAMWGKFLLNNTNFLVAICFLFLLFYNDIPFWSMILMITKRAYTGFALYFVGRIFVGGWNDQDKGSRFEGQRGNLS